MELANKNSNRFDEGNRFIMTIDPLSTRHNIQRIRIYYYYIIILQRNQQESSPSVCTRVRFLNVKWDTRAPQTPRCRRRLQ